MLWLHYPINIRNRFFEIEIRSEKYLSVMPFLGFNFYTFTGYAIVERLTSKY